MVISSFSALALRCIWLCAFCAVVSKALLPGQWQVFSRSLPIHSMESDERNVWLASNGGVRKIFPDGSTRLFTTTDGLEEAANVLVVPLPADGAIAISTKGIISGFNPLIGRFETWNRSLLSIGDRLYKQVYWLDENYLVLALENRLAFFHIPSRRFIITLTSFGSHQMSTMRVEDILHKQDTMFVAIDSVVYSRSLIWDNIENDNTMPDPYTWEVHQKMPYPVRALRLQGDSIFADSLDRIQIRRGNQSVAVYPHGIIRGIADTLPIDTSINLHFLAPGANNSWFVAGNNRLYRVLGDSIVSLDPSPEFQLEKVHTLAISPAGELAGWGFNLGVHFRGGELRYFHSNPEGLPTEYAPAIRELLKTMQFDSQNNLHIGLWGFGIVSHPSSFFRGEGGLAVARGSRTGHCVPEWILGSHWVLIRGMATVPDLPGVLFTYWGGNNSAYGIGYIHSDGRMICMAPVATGDFSTVLQATRDPATGHIRVYSGYEASMGGVGGVHTFLLADPEQTGYLQLQSPVRDLATGRIKGPKDMALDTTGRLWVMGDVGLGYWNGSDDSITTFTLIPGYEGKIMSALASDPAGGLWLGTLGDGSYHLKFPPNAPDSLRASRLRTSQGLLSETIYDIAVNPQNGEVWFGHDVGMSRYRSLARSTEAFQRQGYPMPIAYPNPFRLDRHSQLIIDRVDPSSKVIIQDAGGLEVVRFSGADLEGGMLRWNGIMSNGKTLASGVYHYTVHGPRGRFRGKILVIH